MDEVVNDQDYKFEFPTPDDRPGPPIISFRPNTVQEHEFWDRFGQPCSNYTKRCENLNTMVSSVWWLIGFYWMVSGGEILLHNAPRLYWLTMVFLAFDVFFSIFCVVLACLIGIALCCCLPCIIAILYAVVGQEGASESDLNVLPKYKFQLSNNNENKPDVGAGKMVPVVSNVGHLDIKRVLLPEDADEEDILSVLLEIDIIITLMMFFQELLQRYKKEGYKKVKIAIIWRRNRRRGERTCSCENED